MREHFPWFLDPTEEELQRLWEEAIFSFDANVLLNLYRVDRETTQDYFKIFRALGDRIFLPHEAANQFFLNRRSVIRTEQNSFSKAKEVVENWVERRKVFNNIKNQLRGDDIGQIIEDEIESVFENRMSYEEEVEAVKEDLIARIKDLEERFTPTGTTRANTEEDEILKGLMDIFEGRTGEALDEDIEDLKGEAQERYEKEKPPGYEDYDVEDELSRGECEDFLIWKQLMNLAERKGEDVVFITGEEKPDWWEVDKEQEIVRPRHELLREFSRETGRGFWILSTERLIESANERLGLDVKDKSVEQTDKISEIDKTIHDKEVYKISNEILDKYNEIRDRSYNLDRLSKNLDIIIEYIENSLWERTIPSIQKWENRVKNNLNVMMEISDVIGDKQIKRVADYIEELIISVKMDDKKEAKVVIERMRTYLNQLAKALKGEAEAIIKSKL